MKPIAAGLLLAACVVLAAQTDAPENTLTPQEASDGWVLLFDGKTMDNWVDPRQKTPPGDAWTIEDGCLKARSKPRITEDLFSKSTYRDFELAFDWRISPAGNSGVKYLIQDHVWLPREPGKKFEERVEDALLHRIAERPERGQDYVIGLEYQITDDSSNRDATGNFKHTAGSLYGMFAPSSHPAKAVGEFNRSRIVVRGNHVEHWMNGVKIVDASLDDAAGLSGFEKRWSAAPRVLELLTKLPKRDCPFSLQNHGDEAWFRNIKIKRL